MARYISIASSTGYNGSRSPCTISVRAVIVDKDNAPRWSPTDLEGVTDEMLDELFAPLPPGEEWTPLP